MIYWGHITVFCGVFSYAISNPICKITESDCLNKISVDTYSKFLKEDPVLGTENMDPMHFDVIEGNLSNLKYKLTDATVTGFKDCQIENVKLTSALDSLHIALLCPKLTMTGMYDIKGTLLSLPVEGNGDFSVVTNKYRIAVDAKLKVGPGKDSKTYITMESYKHTAEPLESVQFDFKNLFNGQNKDLADSVSKFAKENWSQVAKEVQPPIFEAILNKLMNNANKYFIKRPIDHLL